MSMGLCGRFSLPVSIMRQRRTRTEYKLKLITCTRSKNDSLPQNYMFKEMRAALDIPRSVDILDHIRSLSDEPDAEGTGGHKPDHTSSSSSHESSPAPAADTVLLSHSASTPNPPPTTSPQARAIAKIQAIERTAMTSQRPQPGLQELMAYLTRRGVPKALCTRNFPAPVHHLLQKFLQGEVFDPIITRETEGVRPKPSPEGLWSIAQAWGLDGVERGVRGEGNGTGKGGRGDHRDDGPGGHEEDVLELARAHLGSGLIMVGDSIDDVTAGRRAGAATVLLVNDENRHLATHENTDLTVTRLDDLIEILERGFEARA